jgi:ParB family transcriptional regulator, chromosome partitioning protein
VYGQGRLEACVALGWKEIPAIVVEVTKEECLLRSLVENLARRFPSPLALVHEIDRLKTLGYSNVEIGKKLDMHDGTVGGYVALKKAGEERLLDAAVTGVIPLGVAMEIAKAETPEMQRELLKAYQSKQLTGVSIRVVKRLMDQRRFLGKKRETSHATRKPLTSAESLVNAYKKESQRQKLMVKKAKVCEARLLFVVTALTKLLADEGFLTLLKAEALTEIPEYLHDKMTGQRKEAA